MAGAAYMPTDNIAVAVEPFPEGSDQFSAIGLRIKPMTESVAEGLVNLLDGQLGTTSQVARSCRVIAT